MSRRQNPARCSVGLLAVTLLATCAAGCTTVEPWERGTLAKPHMAIDPFPAQTAWRSHVQGARQAAPAGMAAEGGGCGCN